MKRIVFLLFALVMALPVVAETTETDAVAKKTSYYALVPALVGNYHSEGRLSY